MRVPSHEARYWYMREAASQGWPVRTLSRQISSFAYERTLRNDTGGDSRSKRRKKVGRGSIEPREFIKDPYVLEFLETKGIVGLRENGLEQAIIDRLQDFMLELGKGFAFVGRQFRVSTETKHFFIDLVFYNHILKCFVLVDYAGPVFGTSEVWNSTKQRSAELTVSGSINLFGQRQEILLGASSAFTDSGDQTTFTSPISSTYVPYPGGPVGAPPINVIAFNRDSPLYSEPPAGLPNYVYSRYGSLRSGAYVSLRFTAFDRLHLSTGVRNSHYRYDIAYHTFCTNLAGCSGTPVGGLTRIVDSSTSLLLHREPKSRSGQPGFRRRSGR